jgi:glycerol uptake facilitator-like aquaporin
MLCFQQTGSQLNPVISLNLFLRGQITLKICLVNMAAQLLGAILGSFVTEYRHIRSST